MGSIGYSGTPLLKKLGVKPGHKLLLINTPQNYFDLLEADLTTQLCKPGEVADFVHLFAKNNNEFQQGFRKIMSMIRKNSNLVTWVSWHKKSAGIATDLTEDNIRAHALRNGLVDVKVCAVSEVWSGLKLVVPLKQRKE